MGTRRSIVRGLLIVPLVIGALALALGMPAPAAAAPARICDDATAPIGFGETVRGNLVVPAGAACNFAAATVRGDVTVEPGGTLGLRALSDVRGSISATSASRVSIVDSVVRGNVSVSGSSPDASGFLVGRSEVRGSVNASGVVGRQIVLDDTTVRGGVILRNNTETGGRGVVVSANVIGGNLDCSGNAPEVVNSDRSNTVGGAKLGQCAGL